MNSILVIATIVVFLILLCIYNVLADTGMFVRIIICALLSCYTVYKFRNYDISKFQKTNFREVSDEE